MWPSRNALLAAAEGKMVPSSPPDALDKLYENTKPVTLNGFHTYITWLEANGHSGKARDLVRDRWIEGPISDGDDTDFHARYRRYISNDDTLARLDRLVWEGESTAAANLYDMVGNSYADWAEARLALSRGAPGAMQKLAQVDSALRNTPAIFYARAFYAYESGNDNEAVSLLLQSATAEGDVKKWWKLRHTVIRNQIENRDYKTAYKLAATHGAPTGVKEAADAYATAEFLAGWLALRFLNDADRARQHFQNVADNVQTPVSKSRGAYWLGRAFEAKGETEAARNWYQQAATYHAFFYGQLAMAKLNAAPELSLPPEPHIPANKRASFMALPLPTLIDYFARNGDTERATKFVRALLPVLDERSEFQLVAELAGRTGQRSLEVEVAKAANSKGHILYHAGYPLARLDDGTPERALSLGLIRQESQFDSQVESSAGAIGLMQMLPSSAKQIAKKHGIPFRGASTLRDPNANVTLGRAYLGDRIRQFDGSYILAIAAYNAGQGRVRQWLNSIGDPRLPASQGGVDPIDWIELIPIYETRNYVQRVLEGTQIYRTRLAGDHSTPLEITKDLRR